MPLLFKIFKLTKMKVVHCGFRFLLKSNLKRWHPTISKSFSYYPVNDNISGLNLNQRKLRETVFQLCQKELTPLSHGIDMDDKFPMFKDFFKTLGALGLLGLNVPAKDGGTGLGFMESCIVMEEMSRACAAVALSFNSHATLSVNQITKNGSEKQKCKFLPKMISGEHIGAVAISEAESGSDALSMRLKAEKKGDYYILNGSKFWVTNFDIADILLVYAKTDFDAKPQYGISLFIIEKGMEGFSVGKPLEKLGMRGSPTGELIFEDCKVPAENLLGSEGKGVYVLMNGLDVERLVLAAGPVGIMQACCDAAFDYVHHTTQTGHRIGEFQLIQEKIADMNTTLNACRAYLFSVARAADQGHINSKVCAGVILYCAEKATQMALDAIQCLGENGYTNDCITGRLLRDTKLFEIGGGTSEIQRMIIGRALKNEYGV